ncbi:MAG TPA: hypothetical protein VFB24_06000, partial [Candidatus Binatia bacterium]|nr:hypothetical protein [Candidatus Binatia bacterium]
LAVHHHQYDYVKGHADRELAYAEGDKYLREYYGNKVFRQLRARPLHDDRYLCCQECDGGTACPVGDQY